VGAKLDSATVVPGAVAPFLLCESTCRAERSRFAGGRRPKILEPSAWASRVDDSNYQNLSTTKASTTIAAASASDEHRDADEDGDLRDHSMTIEAGSAQRSREVEP
jgi:hypothetical protein